MINTVIFDWGETMAPSRNGGWFAAFQRFTNLKHDTALSIWREQTIGLNTARRTVDDFWDGVENSLGKPLPLNKNDIWVEGLARTPYKEMDDLVRKLHTKGITTAILSNTLQAMEQIDSLDNMYVGFDEVILSHRVGVAKPDPKIFTYTMQVLGVTPAECLFVDDKETNLHIAKKFGMATVLANKDPKITAFLVMSYFT